MTEIVIISILAIIIVALLIALFVIKSQMREIEKELEKSKSFSYNRPLTITLIDKDMSNMVNQLNSNLDYQKQLKLESEKIKSDLKRSISDIAHDLRTPVTVVNGNLQMLKRSNSLSEKELDYLNIALEKTDTVKNLVDEFFEMSVLESDDVPVALESFDLTAFVITYLIEREALIREKNFEPNIHIPEKKVMINADKGLLTRMLDNLLNNIFKYARNSFSLTLSDDDKVRLIFSNKLSSDDPVNTDKLFERTYRNDNSRSVPGNAGLGLYIVKLLAIKQNISVSASQKKNILEFIIEF